MPMRLDDGGDPFANPGHAEFDAGLSRPPFLASEANAKRSRGAGVVGAVVVPGTVMQLDGGLYMPVTDPARACAVAIRPAVEGEAVALLVRDCEVIAALLRWPDLPTTAQRTAAALALSIFGDIVLSAKGPHSGT